VFDFTSAKLQSLCPLILVTIPPPILACSLLLFWVVILGGYTSLPAAHRLGGYDNPAQANPAPQQGYCTTYRCPFLLLRTATLFFSHICMHALLTPHSSCARVTDTHLKHCAANHSSAGSHLHIHDTGTRKKSVQPTSIKKNVSWALSYPLIRVRKILQTPPGVT
jgi:hypothetical protein